MIRRLQLLAILLVGAVLLSLYIISPKGPAMPPWLFRLLPFALGAVAIIGAYHVTPVVGAGARIQALKEARDTWKAKAEEARQGAQRLEKSFRDSEAARTRDQRAAAAAATEADRACDARLAETRRSIKVIERIINAPVPPDARGCPSRQLVDPRELRDALHPRG